MDVYPRALSISTYKTATKRKHCRYTAIKATKTKSTGSGAVPLMYKRQKVFHISAKQKY